MQGDVENWFYDCYQSQYCNLIDSVEHITGSARVSAPGLDIISVRSEDLLEDLELEVRMMLNLGQFCFSNYQIDWTTLL